MNQLAYIDCRNQTGAPAMAAAAELQQMLDAASQLERTVSQLTARMAQACLQLARAEPADQNRGQTTKQILSFRDRRKGELGDVFGDPAWDILTFLLWGHFEQRRLSVGDVCNGAGVATTTGLRWIERLRAEGFLIVLQDPLDKRRKFVALTGTAAAKLEKLIFPVSTIQAAA